MLKSDFENWNKEVLDNASIRKELAFNEEGFGDSKEREDALFL